MRVSLLLRPSEGALLRVLGTAQRRGYELAGVRTSPYGRESLWLVELDFADGMRELQKLRRQLEKLYDVVMLDPPAAERAELASVPMT